MVVSVLMVPLVEFAIARNVFPANVIGSLSVFVECQSNARLKDCQASTDKSYLAESLHSASSAL